MELIDSMSNPVKFIIVFLLILAVLAPLLWRRFNAGPSSSPRGRHPRLAVVETAAVDVRHRLVLVKRDNMEHLLLIGGPTNIVVESNIVRTTGPAALPRPIPDARAEAVRQPVAPAAEAPDWSLQMEQPVARPVRTVDLDAALQEPPARTAREAMADSMRAVRSSAAARRNPPELDNAPEEVAAPTLMPGDVGHRAPPIMPDPPRRGAPVPEPQPVHRPQSPPPEPPPPPANDAPAESRPRERVIPAAQRPAPPMVPAAGAQHAPHRQVQPAPPTVPAANVPRPIQHMPAAPPPARPAPPSDQGNFAEMAQRLEAALRRPNPAKADPSGRPSGRAEPTMGRKPAPPEAAPKVNVKAPDMPPDLKVPSGKGKNESAMESLEDEMAKMLGRPGKS